MSLLMEALKKAEKAKLEAEQDESVTVDEHSSQHRSQHRSQQNYVPISLKSRRKSGAISLEPAQLPADEINFKQADATLDLKKDHAPDTRSAAAGLASAELTSKLTSKTVMPVRSADMSLVSRPDLDHDRSSQTQAVELQNSDRSVQDPLSNSPPPSLEKVEKDIQPKEAAANMFAAKTPKRALTRQIKYLIAASTGMLVVFIAVGYVYYQSLADSLQSDINAAVSPVMQQQKQLALKNRNIAKNDLQGQVAKAEKKMPVTSSAVEVREKSIATTKVVAKPVKKVAAAKSSQARKKTESSARKTTPITVKRQLAPNMVYQLLTQAYSAYQLGNDREAVSLYSKVLQQEKNNRDAMLGLAAISIRNIQYDKARNIYLALLENNPKDSVAMSGLLNIQSNVDPGKSETQIKLLLDHDPGSPYLLFTLGSLYASQQRWADAQKVFFKAYSSDSQNADITYNLAVSLDQLEQRKVALKYYRAALELVKNKPVTFKVSDVMRRINVLQRVSGG